MSRFQNLSPEQFIHSNFPYRRYSLDYTLNSLRRIGAGKIGFYAAEPQFCMYEATYTDMKVLDAKLRSHGLSVVEINPENCAYPTNLASTNPVTRERTLRYFETAIRTAGVIGAPYVMVFPGFAPMDVSPESVWPIAVDSMGQLADFAAAEGVGITFEATTRDITLITDHHKVMQLIADCGRDNLAVTIDTMTINQTGESVDDVFRICGAQKVVNVHFVDAGQNPSGAWEHRIPGEGTLDLKEILRAFDENGYRNYFADELRFSLDPCITTPEAIFQKKWAWIQSQFASETTNV